jgi:hypothetical protein
VELDELFKADVESVKERREKNATEGSTTEAKMFGRWEDPGKQRNGDFARRSTSVLEPVNEIISAELNLLD